MLDQTRNAADGKAAWHNDGGSQGLATGSDDLFEERSLIDGVSALYEDGKTYVSAELAFQKTRASYVGKKGSKAAVFGLGALAFLHLALIALTVGAVLALATLVGPLAATLIVGVLLLAGAAIFAMMAKSRVEAISRTFTGEKP